MVANQLFAAYPKRETKYWLKQIPPFDRTVFAQLGRLALMYKYGFEIGYAVFHQAGGRKRAATAKRDKRGRFKKGGM